LDDFPAPKLIVVETINSYRTVIGIEFINIKETIGIECIGIEFISIGASWKVESPILNSRAVCPPISKSSCI